MAENLTEAEVALVTAVDTSYLLLTGINILFMQAGFTAFEAGGSRAKHVKSVLFKNLLDHSVGALAWFTIGWGLFTGSNAFAAGEDATFFVHDEATYARLFQQFAFAATAATIVSSAVTGRCRLEAYVLLSAFVNGITYPIAAHWAWSEGGWLYKLGFLDFAGSTVVHAFGGAVALTAAWLCGPRPGRFVEDKKMQESSTGPEPSFHRGSSYVADLSYHNGSEAGASEAGSAEPFVYQPARAKPSLRCKRPGWGLYKTRIMPRGYNPPLQVLGALFLYVAWFSFNAGSAGSIYSSPDLAARAAINTMMAAGASVIACMVMTKLARVHYDIEAACNALLAGLVAITAPSGFVTPWAAVVVGILACPVNLISTWFVLRVMGLDDVLGAFSVHCSAGTLGTIWLGLAHPDYGLFYGHGASFLGVQVLGSFAIPLFAGITSFIFILLPLYLTNSLSHTINEQLLGVDFVHFGGEFGKDVDLESGEHGPNSMHSDRDDIESQEGKFSNNSSFVEEFPASVNFDSSTQSKPTPAAPAPTAPSRSFSVATMEGRRNVHTELRRVLDEDPRIRARFRAYLEVMHKDEGVAFWDDVTKWKKISSKKFPDKKIRGAKRIIRLYCLESSNRQVNLASKLVAELASALDSREELLKNTIFDTALEELFRDLRHDFTEFINNTPGYWS